jgi:hypothetical protein
MQSSNDPTRPQQPAPKAERPRAEPEIIPPGVDIRSEPQFGPTVFAYRTSHIHVRRLGPVGITLVLIGVGILAFAGAALLLGAALIGAVAGGVIVAGVIATRLFRSVFGR